MDLFSLLSQSGGQVHQEFRNLSIFTQGAKWGNAAKCNVDLTMVATKKVFVQGAYVGSSWSVINSSVSIESFVPTEGKRYQQQILRAFTLGEYVWVTAGEVGRQILQLGYMQVQAVKVDSDMAKGSLVLNVSLEGGTPDVLQSTEAIPLRLGGI